MHVFTYMCIDTAANTCSPIGASTVAGTLISWLASVPLITAWLFAWIACIRMCHIELASFRTLLTSD